MKTLAAVIVALAVLLIVAPSEVLLHVAFYSLIAALVFLAVLYFGRFRK